MVDPDEVAAWVDEPAAALLESGGPLTDSEIAWADEILSGP
jgi:hypothetical protein